MRDPCLEVTIDEPAVKITLLYLMVNTEDHKGNLLLWMKVKEEASLCQNQLVMETYQMKLDHGVMHHPFHPDNTIFQLEQDRLTGCDVSLCLQENGRPLALSHDKRCACLHDL
jgi:hypothetical protein